jgi:hypothetical protein
LGVMRLRDRVGGIEMDEGIRHVAGMHAPNCWRHCRPRGLWRVSLATSADAEDMKRVGVVRIAASESCSCR